MSEKKDISLIVEKAKNEFGTSKLAGMLGLHPVQINSVIRGVAGLPFIAALRLSEILEADPITILCANAALMEKHEDRKMYLESKILPLEISRIILHYDNKINLFNDKKESVCSSRGFFKKKEKDFFQGEKAKKNPYFNPPWFFKKYQF
jgi:plasmid maintenance system antidote protein VapI